MCEEMSRIINVSKGPYLAGPDVSLADVMIWPFIERAVMCAELFGPGNNAVEMEPVSEWIAYMQQREAVKLAQPDARCMGAALRKTMRLDWFDYETTSISDTHPHLSSIVSA
jgi:glutathione S-transferase